MNEEGNHHECTHNQNDDPPTPVEQVSAAVLKTVGAEKYLPGEVDTGNFRIAFASGKSVLSWGNEYIVPVSLALGGTLFELECGGIAGVPKALMGKWKNGKQAQKTLAAIALHLP